MNAERSGGDPPRGVEALGPLLRSLEGRGYKAYGAIAGDWLYPDFVLSVDHVQGDPYATPSRVHVRVSPSVARLPTRAFRGTARTTGTAAFLARAFSEKARAASRERGSGKSGQLAMEHPGQKTLLQTAVSVGPDGEVEARFTIGLPARGRRVNGHAAAEMFEEDVPRLVRETLVAAAHDPATLESHAATNEDAVALRAALPAHGLVAFVAEGSILPRRSGVDDRPLDASEAIPFVTPRGLSLSLDLPNAGPVTGMGIREGVTLIVGGGFHGKSTLLRALEAGVYNHRPGDGRERVVARADTVKVRAEDGRSVAAVDISGFIDRLPFGRDTERFTSANASGSTSQAAAIVEAREAGARGLLVDEDTAATNFMIRDRRMQLLVPHEGEPITPLVDRVRELYDRDGVSTVLVIGGSGDYLDVADCVIRMLDYKPHDATEEARRVVAEHPTRRSREHVGELSPPRVRRIGPGALDPRSGKRASYVRVLDDRTLLFGRKRIDLVAVEQLASRAQIRAIGQALAYLAERLRDGPLSVPEALDAVEAAVRNDGLDVLEPRKVGDLAEFRRFELAAALNRVRGLRVE